MQHRHYPKLGGDLAHGCQRFAKGLGAVGAIAVLYRGENEEIEVGMTFAPQLKVDAATFLRLRDEILKNTYATSIGISNKACIMLAEATGAECVILFVIEKDGAVRIAVSAPKSNEFVADYTLQIANRFNAMN